jgi:hypothetical protein
MEQIVLHTTDHAAEGRDIQSQDTVTVHAAKFVCDAGRRAQDTQEQAVIPRVLPELLVNQVQIPLNETDGVGTDAANVIVLLQ